MVCMVCKLMSAHIIRLTWHVHPRYAMKTLEKSEMLERNKVGRVLTEEGILNQGNHLALSQFATQVHIHTHTVCAATAS